MNIDFAIDLHRTALLRLLTVMFAALGIGEGGAVSVVRERTRLMVLRVLGPAESAVRRLIFLTARSMSEARYVRRASPAGAIPRGEGRSKPLPFPLFDPRKTFGTEQRKPGAGPGPRIFFLDGSDPVYAPESEEPKLSLDDLVSASSLCQRLNSVAGALGDLAKQAKRLKRAEARRKASRRLAGVLRIHLPPGHRQKGNSTAEREVDDILRECQILARRWIAAQDTS